MSNADADGPVPALAKLYPIAALLCSGTSFPLLLMERLMKRPAPDRLIPGYPGDFYHWFKNYSTEHFGADAQWWSKFTCFVMLVQAVVIGVLCVQLIVQ